MITQDELLVYYSKSNAIEAAETKLKLAKAQQADLKADLIKRLLKKEKVEKGRLTATIRSEWKRASISWKSVVQDLKGKLFIEKILAGASRDEVFVLEVEDAEP